MSKPKTGLLRGRKISDSHQTIIDDAKIVIEAAKKDENVTKIVIGEIINLSGGKPRLKFKAIPAGFQITVRGIGMQQTLFIYTKDPKSEEFINDYFDSH